jgi:hypothetical protein
MESISIGRTPANALSDYEQKRNAAAKPYYTLNIDAARMKPYPAQQIALLKALASDPASTEKFFGILTGVVNPNELFNPHNLFQILGVTGLTKLLLSRLLPQRQPSRYSA